MPTVTAKLSLKERVTVAVKGQYVYNYNANPINPLFGPQLTFDQTGIGDYKSYPDQVRATYRKYLGEDYFGRTYVKSIVDFRTSYIAGNGAVIKANEKNSIEAKFVEGFLKINKLDGGNFSTLVRYTELEGRGLLVLNQKEYDRMKQVKATHIPWDNGLYTPIQSKTQPDVIEKIEMAGKDIMPDRFVYMQTGGVPHRPERPTNKIHIALNDLEHLDRCLQDWGQYNQLYGLGTPVFEMMSWEDAEEIAKQIKDMDWKAGKSIAMPGKHYYAVPDGAGQASMEAEIKTRIKKVSGLTGMPPHFFGFTDLLSNRATAESMLEQISIATTEERNTIQDKLIELVQKSVDMYNKLNNAKVDASKISVQLPMASQEQIKLLFDVYVPLSQMGYISKDTVRNMVPNTDPEEEAKKMASEPMTSSEIILNNSGATT
jgi:hypothetical protein